MPFSEKPSSYLKIGVEKKILISETDVLLKSRIKLLLSGLEIEKNSAYYVLKSEFLRRKKR